MTPRSKEQRLQHLAGRLFNWKFSQAYAAYQTCPHSDFPSHQHRALIRKIIKHLSERYGDIGHAPFECGVEQEIALWDETLDLLLAEGERQ